MIGYFCSIEGHSHNANDGLSKVIGLVETFCVYVVQALRESRCRTQFLSYVYSGLDWVCFVSRSIFRNYRYGGIDL